YSMFGSIDTGNATGLFRRKALLNRVNSDSGGALAFVLFVLCEIYQREKTPAVEILERLFRLAWETHLRSLRVRALQMLECAAHHVISNVPQDVERIRNVLDPIAKSPDRFEIGLSNAIVEALNAYEM